MVLPGRSDATPPRKPADDLVAAVTQRILREKRENLRLIRALDLAGASPEGDRRLAKRLAALTEFDFLLTGALYSLELDTGGDAGAHTATLEEVLGYAPKAREQVLAALSRPRARAVREALPATAASEAEIRLEVGRLARAAEADPGLAEDDRDLLDAARTDLHTTEAAYFAGRPPDEVGEARVARHEETPLPAESETEAWLSRLPLGWLETIARMHDVDPDASGASLESRTSARLRDSGWLEQVLRERLGAAERAFLPLVLGDEPVVLDALPDPNDGAFDVTWDWEGSLPATPGGKLRALGLVHVGTLRGERVAAIPPALRDVAWRALLRADPHVLRRVPNELRDETVAAVLSRPIDDEALRAWKAADAEGLRAVDQWLGERRELGPAVDAFFGPSKRRVEDEADAHFLAEFLLFDWRDEHGRSAVETWLPRAAGLPARVHEVLGAIGSSPVSLWRLEETDPPRGARLTDLFRGGEPVFVSDRALSLTGLPGSAALMRVYPAGPYRFASAASRLLDRRRSQQVIEGLEKRFSAWSVASGSRDRDAFLRAHPEAVHRVTHRR